MHGEIRRSEKKMLCIYLHTGGHLRSGASEGWNHERDAHVHARPLDYGRLYQAEAAVGLLVVGGRDDGRARFVVMRLYNTERENSCVGGVV